MKKTTLISLCLLTTAGAMAQTSLVKEVERKMKSNPENYQENIVVLTPAFTDAETADGAYVWFVAGKGGMDYFDNQQGMMQIGRDVDKSAIGHALIDSYGYMNKALEKDPVADAKGKVKTKYTKDILKLLNGHYNDFNNAAVYMWEAQDYNGAYDAWTIYAEMPENAALAEAGLKQLPDTILSDIYYNRALAAWQANRLEDALKSFDKAQTLGYNKQQLYDYAIGVASQMGDTEKMADYAAQAYKIFGSEGNNYIGWMINDKLKKEKYAEAESLLNEYIANTPDDPQLYYVLGIVYDTQDQADKATAQYQKALSIAPDHAKANYQYGRQLYNKALILDDEASTKNANEYNEMRANQIDPLFVQAAGYLEKAYSIDPDNNHDALGLLRTIYYNLNDEDNLKRIEELQKY